MKRFAVLLAILFVMACADDPTAPRRGPSDGGSDGNDPPADTTYDYFRLSSTRPDAVPQPTT